MRRQAWKIPAIPHHRLDALAAGLRARQHLLVRQQLVGHAAFHVQLHHRHTRKPGSQPANPLQDFSRLSLPPALWL